MTRKPDRQQPRVAALSLRYRTSLLYAGRRKTVLAEPVEAMRRVGLHPFIEEQHRHARSHIGEGITIEVGFVAGFRVFGALIDTLWTGKHGEPGPSRILLGYRFGRNARFTATTKSDKARQQADALNSEPTLHQLIERAELKTLHVEDSPQGRRVQLQPLAGTITALYFPPLPPYTVPIRPDEADAQLKLLTHLLLSPSPPPK